MEFEPFPQYLQKRFSPCVFAFVSDDAKAQFPNYKEMIITPWKEALEKTNSNYRMIFLEDLTTEQTILESLKKTKKQANPFPDPNKKRREFNTTAVLRQKLIDYDFLPQNLFCDLPIGILAIVSGPQLPGIPLSAFPKWSRAIIEKTKANSLKLPANDAVGALRKWIEIVLNKRYEQMTATIKNNYDKNWGSIRQSFVSILEQRIGQAGNAIDIKYYADMCMQQKKYKDACNAYSLLIDNTPQVVGNALSAEAHFMIAISDILRGFPTQQSLFAIQSSMRLLKTSIHVCKCALVDFYIRASMGNNPAVSLQPLCQEPKSSLMKLVHPFAKEQLAQLLKPNHASMHLSQTAPYFHALNYDENTLRDLCGALTPFGEQRWEFLMQTIIEEASHYGKIPQDILELLASSKNVYLPETFEKLLKEGTWKCGFVHAKAHSFYSEGFMCTKPLEYNEEWCETAERLFGAYRPGTFFNATVLDNKECLLNDQVDIRTLIKSPCGNVQIKNLRLRITGCEADVTAASVARSAVVDVNLSFTPRSTGTLTVTGVQFSWGAGVDFYVDFMKPLVFTVHEKAPQIAITAVEKKASMYSGEIAQFVFKIKNSDYPLTHMMFYSTGVQGKLIEPAADEICGQYSLVPLKPNEEQTIRVAFSINKPGFYHSHILLSYWNRNEGPARYSHVHLMINVKGIPKLNIVQNEGSFCIKLDDNLKAIGFTSPSLNTEDFSSLNEDGSLTLHMISQGLKHETKLPDYVDPFFVNDKLRFWFSTLYGTVSVPINAAIHPIQVLVERIDTGSYILHLHNTGKTILKDVRIIVLGQDDPATFYLSGKGIVIIDKLQPHANVSVPLNFVMFSKKTTANLLVSYDVFFISQNIVIE